LYTVVIVNIAGMIEVRMEFPVAVFRPVIARLLGKRLNDKFEYHLRSVLAISVDHLWILPWQTRHPPRPDDDRSGVYVLLANDVVSVKYVATQRVDAAPV